MNVTLRNRIVAGDLRFEDMDKGEKNIAKELSVSGMRRHNRVFACNGEDAVQVLRKFVHAGRNSGKRKQKT